VSKANSRCGHSMAAGSLDLTDSFRESDRIIIVKDALAGKNCSKSLAQAT